MSDSNYPPRREPFSHAPERPAEKQREIDPIQTAGDRTAPKERHDGLARPTAKAVQNEQDSLVPLPTEPINDFFKMMLSERAYRLYVYPAIEDLRQEYSTHKKAGNHGTARWCLVRAYAFMLFPVAQSLFAMLYVLYKLI